MKNVITALLLMVSLNCLAQPPKIRVRGSLPHGTFAANTSFAKDTKYYSADNRYFLHFQADGNLVMYKVTGSNSFTPIWNTHTNGKAVKSCNFQADGNLVLYDYTNKAVWDAYTDRQNREKKGLLDGDTFYPAGTKKITVQVDGNLVITSDGSPVWNSGSFEKNN